MLSEKYDEALQFASQLHRSQVRKGTQIPYISHLMSVSSSVLENNGTEIQALVSEDEAKQFCEIHCAREKPDGIGSCKLTDLQ